MKRIASLSLDLDNQWSYMKTRGDAGWEEFPSYLDIAVPRILDVLKQHGLTITFFVIGQDAALEKNRNALLQIAAAGHEIANHSFRHEPWLHLYSKDELTEEFDRTEKALDDVFGIRPKGFRGPGYSLTEAVIETLDERGYEYDASELPTFVGPFARAFFFLTAPRMSAEEKACLKKLYGKFSNGFKTLKAHPAAGSRTGLVEIPVTTFPVVKAPVHASYLMYLGSFSHAAAKAYWRSAMAACSFSGVEPSFLLHPTDFISGDDVEAMRYFPGMNVAAGQKLELLDHILSSFLSKFDVKTMAKHASIARERCE